MNHHPNQGIWRADRERMLLINEYPGKAQAGEEPGREDRRIVKAIPLMRATGSCKCGGDLGKTDTGGVDLEPIVVCLKCSAEQPRGQRSSLRRRMRDAA